MRALRFTFALTACVVALCALDEVRAAPSDMQLRAASVRA